MIRVISRRHSISRHIPANCGPQKLLAAMAGHRRSSQEKSHMAIARGAFN
jgi:hypothetical protein